MRNPFHCAVASLFTILIGVSTSAFAETTGQYIDDTTLTTKVKAALLGDSQLRSLQINVTTTQGVVDLSGTVNSKSDESEAIKVANKIDGVKSVNDDMVLKSAQAQ